MGGVLGFDAATAMAYSRLVFLVACSSVCAGGTAGGALGSTASRVPHVGAQLPALRASEAHLTPQAPPPP